MVPTWGSRTGSSIGTFPRQPAELSAARTTPRGGSPAVADGTGAAMRASSRSATSKDALIGTPGCASGNPRVTLGCPTWLPMGTVRAQLWSCCGCRGTKGPTG